MDEKRLQAYLNLIQSLLSFPVEKEQEILIGNINLIDSGLLHIIEQVSAMLASQGNQNAVNRLRGLADKLTIALNRPLVANPEAYRDFVLEVLNTMRQSEGDLRVMYPLLQAHLDKLNDSFAQVLHIFGSESFHKVTPENAQSVAATIHDFGNLIKEFPLGNRANNIEIAIACYEVAATVYTREAFPEHWGLIQSSLGTAYLDRIKENKAENIEQAIRYYKAALEVRNCKEAPTQWATTQVNLGGAYLDRIKGDRADNLEMAIQCHQAALQVYDREKFPKKWATIQNNLGGVYLRRIRGNRSDNIETAIACFDTALQIRTYEANPQEWAMTQQNLGVAYLEYLKGDRALNLEQSICYFQAALQVFKRDNLPEKWAEIQINLGKAYDERIYGNRIENQEQAIAYYLAGLSVHTREDFPEKWAGDQHNLGGIYGDRIKGDRAENSELAISAYQLALSVYTREDFPEKWATVQLDLGVAYYRRMVFDSREQNLEIAIDCYHKALSVIKRDAFPLKWAGIQFNLGAAYSARKSGDREKNLADAITANQAALQIYTREDFPKDWANIQNNLGQAYSSWSQGDRNENIKLALQYYHAGLEVFTREMFPEDWSRIQMNLGNVYRELGEIAEAIACFRSALEVVTPTSFPINCVVTGYYLGETAFANKLWAEAIEGYGIALEAVETNRSWASTDTRRQEIQQQVFGAYTNIVQAYININQIDKAIEYVERSKARNLVELLANRNLYPKGDFSETVLNELDSLRREIDAEQRRLEIKEIIHNSNSGIISGKRSQPTDTLQATLPARTHLNQLRQQLDELIAREITPIDPNFRLTQKVEPITYNQIQALTDENTAMLEWYITEDKFLTFIITPQSPSRILWQSSKEDLEDLVNWTNEYLKIYLTNRHQWSQDLTSRLQHLAQILHLDKLLSHIPPNCDELVLIPHRFLHLFPLHALPVEVTLAQEGILLDLFPGGVKYAPSCQLLQQAQAKQRSQFSHLFAIQNPTADLTYTDIEVQAIQQHFHPSQILVKGEAKKSAIDNQRLRNAHCVHFSCHGYFNFEQQKSMLSALLLADCCIITPNKPDPTSHLLLQNGTTIDLDKCLTLLDLFTLNLSQCRLVTLSACETGLTDSRYLTDEYIGLNYGFLVAGTASIVCSLWTVNDISTALLIIRFYQNLKSGSTVAVALKQAQLWLRDATTEQLQQWASHLKLASELTERIVQFLDWFDADEQPFQAPYYWAAFCAIGQ